MTSTGTLHVDARDDAVRHITAGNSVDLQGLPGAGCSLLARAIADELEDAGWQVVRVYGVSALRERPLEVLSIAGLVARQGTPQGPATAVSAAVQGILAAVRGGSTVMVIDNVAYLDEISAGAITAAHSQYPFPVLTTTHPRPRPARPESLITAAVQPGVTMQIPPLGYVDTQTLLVETLGGPVESSAVGRIFDASGGLPSMTLSLLDIARNHGTLKLVDGLWQAGPDLWTPEMTRAVEPLLHPLSPGAIDALQALALAGTIDVSTARRLMSWDVLEELDGYKLLRFVPRGDDMLVGVFPLAIIEFFRHHGVGARHLRVDEAVTEALGGTHIHRHISTVTPWSLDLVGTPDIAIPPRIGATTSTGSDADVIVNRLLVEHWHRELLLRRTEWDHTPTPRTAAILLRTLLITGADPEAVLQVRESTPRIGDSRDLAAFDNWYALYLGLVEHNLDWVRSVLEIARTDADEWAGLIDAIEGFIVLMVDHAPDPDDLPPVGKNVPADTREIIETARAEMLLARGNSAAALGVLEPLGQTTSTFALGRSSAEPWAIFLEGRLDEALDKALSLMTVARREFDVEGIVGSAYVAAQVYLTRGRTPELRALLGSVLSAGVLPPLQRPQHVALLSIAATLAAEEGRHATARTLAQQALALQTGPGAWPLGSPTQAIAHLDAADLPPAQAHAQAAEKLWTEAVTLVDKGYLASGYTAGMLAVVEEPTKDRGKTMAKWLKQLDAPVFRQLGLMVTALCDGDPEKLITAAEHLANAGYVWQATRAYAAGLAALRSSGGAARAAEVHEDARRRLEQWGPQAAAGLRSAAEGAELTAREDEIARLAASGMSNQEIARRLLISVRTVENHLHRVFRKLGVENRAEMSRVIQG